jgi:hypothetical protein
MHEKAEKPWFSDHFFDEIRGLGSFWGRFNFSGTGNQALVETGVQTREKLGKNQEKTLRATILKKDHAEKRHFRAEIRLSDPQKSPKFYIKLDFRIFDNGPAAPPPRETPPGTPQNLKNPVLDPSPTPKKRALQEKRGEIGQL